MCSNYLTHLQDGKKDSIVGKIYPASIVPPLNSMPMFLVGLGTGIAPLIACC